MPEDMHIMSISVKIAKPLHGGHLPSCRVAIKTLK